MKAHFEYLNKARSSWQFLIRELESIPFEWHFHPEYELTFSTNSIGKRFIGDHISQYDENDLTLIGPNIPHTWQSQNILDKQEPITVVVIWFSREWINNVMTLFPEFSHLEATLQKSHQGIEFSRSVGDTLRPLFMQMIDASESKKLTLLLRILETLKDTPSVQLASTTFNSQNLNPSQQIRLNKVLMWVHSHFRDAILLKHAANHANMSVSHFVRFFRQHMNQSFNAYLNEMRVGHACSLLIGSELPINLIAEQSGFLNQSNFNRQFKKFKEVTPLQLRKAWHMAK